MVQPPKTVSPPISSTAMLSNTMSYEGDIPPLILSPPATQSPRGTVSARRWNERALVPAPATVKRTEDSHPDILPVPPAAVTNPANPAANVGPWQWAVVVASTAMKSGGGEANSNGRETGGGVAVDC
jgi:hypothetical protein